MAMKTANIVRIFKEVQCKDLYSISFDLKKPDSNRYDRIYNVLNDKSISSGNVTETQCIVRWPNTNAEKVKKYLRSHKVNGKKLFVKADKLNVIAIADFSGFRLPPKF